ncbi:hypothetical protein BGZ94_009225 [Podila epigama]|nr:hypothetical protein BGZ94_009225 [Podila epigama]
MKQTAHATAIPADPENDQPAMVSSSSYSSSKTQFRKEDYEAVVCWLEHRPNFELLHGTPEQVSSGQRNMKAGHGYASLMDWVALKSNGRLQTLSSRAMRERFQRYRKKYEGAKQLSLRPDFGLTAKDRQHGLNTRESKLESLCPYFRRMDSLYAHMRNTTSCQNAEYSDELQDDSDSYDEQDEYESDNSELNDNDSDTAFGPGHDTRLGCGQGQRLGHSQGQCLKQNGYDATDHHMDPIHDPAFAESDVDLMAATRVPYDSLSPSTKRRSLDTSLHDTTKKSRISEAQQATAFMETIVAGHEVMSKLEEKKYKQQQENIAQQLELDRRRLDLEERRIALEREQMERKTQGDQALFQSEARKMRTQLKIQKAILLQTAIGKGFSLDDLKTLMTTFLDD